MVLPRSFRVSIAAGVLAVTAGRSITIDPSPRASTADAMVVHAAMDASTIPAELVPAIIDTLQRTGDASYAPTAVTGATPIRARNAGHRLSADSATVVSTSRATPTLHSDTR